MSDEPGRGMDESLAQQKRRGSKTSQEIDEQGQVLEGDGPLIVSTPKTRSTFIHELWSSAEPEPLSPWNVAVLSWQRASARIERWLTEQFKYHGRQPEDYELRVYEGRESEILDQEYVLLLRGQEVSRLRLSLNVDHKE